MIFTGIVRLHILGKATYKGDETGSPCFILNEKEIYGYECWWIPIKEPKEPGEEVKGSDG